MKSSKWSDASILKEREARNYLEFIGHNLIKITGQSYFVIYTSKLIPKPIPRSIRIEYENAFQHVMNRGMSKQNIFDKEDHFECFMLIA